MARPGVLVGFGVIAEGHAAGYRRQAAMEIVAVVDPSPERRCAAESALPGVRTYSSLDAALDRERPGFVDICTPPMLHWPLMVACLDRGIDVLCEKPLVMDGQEAAALCSALSASKGRLYPCHNYKFAPAVRAMAEHLTACGPVLGGEFTTVRCGHALGVPEWNAHWRRQRSIGGGGILRDHGPHSIYLAEHLVGRPVTRVSCRLRYPAAGPWRTTEEEAAIALFFDDVVINVRLTWNGSERSTRYFVSTDGGAVALVGDEVEIVSDGRRTVQTFPSAFDDPRHGSWFALMLEDAAARLQDPEGTRPLTGEAMRTIAAIEGAYRSANEGGRRISLSLGAGSTSGEASSELLDGPLSGALW